MSPGHDARGPRQRPDLAIHKFARLIRDGNYEAAVTVAREQVEGGANILDVNMDADLIDSEEAMTRFLRLLAGEASITKLPIRLATPPSLHTMPMKRQMPAAAKLNSTSTSMKIKKWPASGISPSDDGGTGRGWSVRLRGEVVKGSEFSCC